MRRCARRAPCRWPSCCGLPVSAGTQPETLDCHKQHHSGLGSAAGQSSLCRGAKKVFEPSWPAITVATAGRNWGSAGTSRRLQTGVWCSAIKTTHKMVGAAQVHQCAAWPAGHIAAVSRRAHRAGGEHRQLRRAGVAAGAASGDDSGGSSVQLDLAASSFAEGECMGQLLAAGCTTQGAGCIAREVAPHTTAPAVGLRPPCSALCPSQRPPAASGLLPPAGMGAGGDADELVAQQLGAVSASEMTAVQGQYKEQIKKKLEEVRGSVGSGQPVGRWPSF